MTPRSSSTTSRPLSRLDVPWRPHHRASPGFRVLALQTPAPSPSWQRQGYIGIQFPPKSSHPRRQSNPPKLPLRVCGCRGDWTRQLINDAVAGIREQVGTGRVICALYGGVDSASPPPHPQSIGDQLTCVFVDNASPQRRARASLETFNRHLNINLVHVDAVDRFSRTSPASPTPNRTQDRRANLIRIFGKKPTGCSRRRPREHARFHRPGHHHPDVIESAPTAPRRRLKRRRRHQSHHNVAACPKK